MNQTDLIKLGKQKNIITRLKKAEADLAEVKYTSGESDEPNLYKPTVRKNLLQNHSFEIWERPGTELQWNLSEGVAINSSARNTFGNTSLQLLPGSVYQDLLFGSFLPEGSFVVSVFARSEFDGYVLFDLDVTNDSGAVPYEAGPIYRIDPISFTLPAEVDCCSSTEDQEFVPIETNVIPPDFQYYRFFQQFVVTGEGSHRIAIEAGDTAEIDGAKYEKEDFVFAYLEPTTYEPDDAGQADQTRNFNAGNINNGTLTVGTSENEPNIEAKNSSDVSILQIRQNGLTILAEDSDNAARFRNGDDNETGQLYQLNGGGNHKLHLKVPFITGETAQLEFRTSGDASSDIELLAEDSGSSHSFKVQSDKRVVSNGSIELEGYLQLGNTTPGSPPSRAIFYREDFKLLTIYDGSDWRSDLISFDWVPLCLGSGISTSQNCSYCVLRQDIGLGIDRIVLYSKVATTNDGSNYWTITLNTVDSAGSETSLWSRDTSGDSPDTQVVTEADSGLGSPSLGDHLLRWNVTKTGGPGNLDVCFSVFYRFIIT